MELIFKKTFMNYLVIVSFGMLFNAFHVNGQSTANVDSLMRVLSLQAEDTMKYKTYVDIKKKEGKE